MTDDTLTVKQLADKLNIHPNTVYAHVARGRIPAMRIGRALRFDLAEVKRALAGASDPWSLPSKPRRAA